MLSSLVLSIANPSSRTPDRTSRCPARYSRELDELQAHAACFALPVAGEAIGGAARALAARDGETPATRIDRIGS
jgi:hypothetical protein